MYSKYEIIFNELGLAMNGVYHYASTVRNWFHEDLDTSNSVCHQKIWGTIALISAVALAVLTTAALIVPALATFKIQLVGSTGIAIAIFIAAIIDYVKNHPRKAGVCSVNSADEAYPHIILQISSATFEKKMYELKNYDGQSVKFGIIYNPDSNKSFCMGNISFSDKVVVIGEKMPNNFDDFLRNAGIDNSSNLFCSNINGSSPFDLFNQIE